MVKPIIHSIRPNEADYVVGGGGGNIIELTAALYSADQVIPGARFLGVSAGAGAVLGLGFGSPAAKLLRTYQRLLKGNKVAKGSIINLPSKFGYAEGEALRDAAFSIVGDATLGDALRPVGMLVSDLYAPEDGPRLLSSWTTPDVLAVDAFMATSAIPVIFTAKTIRGLGLGNRKFVDGGCLKNFPLDGLDDIPERPTVGIRVRPPRGDAAAHPVRAWDLKAFGRALFEMWMWNANNAHNTSKSRSHIIELTGGDSLDFDVPDEVVQGRWLNGVDAGRQGAERARQVLAAP